METGEKEVERYSSILIRFLTLFSFWVLGETSLKLVGVIAILQVRINIRSR